MMVIETRSSTKVNPWRSMFGEVAVRLGFDFMGRGFGVVSRNR
jgi:hypothetical protein